MIINRAVYDLSREQLFSQINDGLIKKETICDMIDMLITTVYGLPRGGVKCYKPRRLQELKRN